MTSPGPIIATQFRQVKNGAGGNSFVDQRGIAGEPGWGASKLGEFAMERGPLWER
jgi:hypothetical protein